MEIGRRPDTNGYAPRLASIRSESRRDADRLAAAALHAGMSDVGVAADGESFAVRVKQNAPIDPDICTL